MQEPIDFTHASQQVAAKRAVAAMDTDVLDKYASSVQEAIDRLSTALGIEQDCYVSGVISTCRTCGYSETIEVPEEANASDVIAAMQLARGRCAECEERERADRAKEEFFE